MKRAMIAVFIMFLALNIESQSQPQTFSILIGRSLKLKVHKIKKSLRKGGTLVIATHGAGNTVPYFSSILDSVQKFIPDYIPSGAPDLDRFGNKTSLKKAIAKAGFSQIMIREYKFWYSPGTFSKYWSDYLKYLAKPLKEKLDKLNPKQKAELKQAIRQKTIPYTKNNVIKFPWKVLILSAKN